VLDGEPAAALAAASSDVDLLICGSHGYGPLPSVLLGGVSRRLVDEARCPVLVLPREADRPLEELLQSLDSLPEDKRTPVRNNGGGHANHSFFWQIMGPDGGGEPSGALADAIQSTFGDLASLKQQVNDAGVKRFGSGWTWLVQSGDGALSVESTPNQDSPVMEGKTPVLGIDVWEHAYYLRYQNRRPDYLNTWWDVVNWDAVAKNFRS
jgi:Fe-Mn family superoxide dismutase